MTGESEVSFLQVLAGMLALAHVFGHLRKIGVERIMFGTDFPALELQMQLEQLMRLPFNNEEKKMIFAENAKRILGLNEL